MKVSGIIPFHKPTLIGEETVRVQQAIGAGEWVGESKESARFFQEYYPQATCFFTNSCTAALEMAVRALGIGAGDEVIIPGFGYVALANAVVNNGAIPVFADVRFTDGNLDVETVQARQTPRTKAVIAIHYAGNPLDAAALRQWCDAQGIYFIEDAAQALGSTHNKRPTGSFGHIGTLSFDYMKNVTCGEGGLLIVNDASLLERVQETYDNGTNKRQFSEGRQKYYEWVRKGGNCQINPLASHFLAAQLAGLQSITETRLRRVALYRKLLSPWMDSGHIHLPEASAGGNGHIFFIVTATEKEREDLRNHLRENGVYGEHHYSSLARSRFGKQYACPDPLPNSEALSGRLLRLPLWNGITEDDIQTVVVHIGHFYLR